MEFRYVLTRTSSSTTTTTTTTNLVNSATTIINNNYNIINYNNNDDDDDVCSYRLPHRWSSPAKTNNKKLTIKRRFNNKGNNLSSLSSRSKKCMCLSPYYNSNSNNNNNIIINYDNNQYNSNNNNNYYYCNKNYGVGSGGGGGGGGPIEFSPVWTELRINNQLCDGVVFCDDGIVFKVHRAILASVSPYFKVLFTNSINRGQPETKVAHVSVPHQIFKKLLDYAYTGNCSVNNENVEYLLRFADQYEILGVVRLCCKYALDQLEANNCMGILRFARHYFCKELEEMGRIFIRQNFMDLLKENNNELLTLSVDELIDILSDDELNIKSEESVFKAIKKWTEADFYNRKKELEKVVNCIRIGTLPYKNISEMLKWKPLDDCTKFKNIIMNLVGDDYEPNNSNDEIDCNDEKDHRFLDMLKGNKTFRPRIPYGILFAVGGWSAGSPTNFIETYDVRADRWLLVTDTDNSSRAYHGLCAIDNLIYMIGGFDGTDHFNTVRCFDPIKKIWKECACMYFPRCYVSVVALGGKIYALGGYNGRVRMKSAERYDPDINQWELIQPMQKQRSDASAAALNKKIYIVGGFNGNEVMSSGESYDATSNQWTFIPSMLSARSGVSLVSYKDALYVFGGFNGYTRLKTAEKFTPTESTDWTDIKEMFCPRSNFATAVLDDYIYAIGGFNGTTTINHVECYNPEKEEWFDVARMNLNRSALSACVLYGLTNARDYSLFGKCQREIGKSCSIKTTTITATSTTTTTRSNRFTH